MGQLFEEAWRDAEKRHAGQKYGKHEYTYHLHMVVAATREIYGDDDVQLAAAALHDTLEDTETTRAYLDAKYGELVATLVWAVSAEADAVNRRAKQKAIAEKLASLPEHLRVRAVNLKMADRTSNQKAAIEEGRWDLVKMYASEKGLYAPLFAQGDQRHYETFLRYCATIRSAA